MLLPWAVPALAASAIWRWLFDDRYGFVNWALVNLGFSHFQDYAWFADRNSAYVAIFVTVVWQSFPFIALSLLAGLQTLPQETLHAAAVDGASSWQRFRLVTLPLLRPILAVLVVFSTIWDFKIFDQIYVMAQGVPDRAADTAAVTAYRESFALGHYGDGLGGRRRPLPRPARLLDRLRAPDREGGRRHDLAPAARLEVRRDARGLARSRCSRVYWVVITSLKPRSEIYTRTPDLWPSDPQWHQYPRVLGEGHVGRALMNSLIVAGATTVICLVVGALAAYALDALRHPAQARPHDARADDADVPARRARDPAVRDHAQRRPARHLRRADRLLPRVHRAARGLGDARLPASGYPAELEHAARTDGATRLRRDVARDAPARRARASRRPRCSCFLEGWKEFMLALTFMNDETRKTLPGRDPELRRPRRHRLGRDHGRERDLHRCPS